MGLTGGTTSRLGLKKGTAGDLDWAADMNANLEAIDGGCVLRGGDTMTGNLGVEPSGSTSAVVGLKASGDSYNYALVKLEAGDGKLWQIVHRKSPDANYFVLQYYDGSNYYDRAYLLPGGNLEVVGGGVVLREISEPSNPASDKAILFCKDNGSGKTQLCVRFSSGASIVLATQP